MKILVLDIETTIDESQFNELEKEKIESFDTDKERDEYIDLLILNPYASKLFCIGLKDYKTGKKYILINVNKENSFKSEDENIKYVFFDSEKELFEKFWDWLDKKEYTHFLTFNGGQFDFPYIMIRSALLNVQPSMNLLRGSKWDREKYHIDLFQKMTFNDWNNSGPLQRHSLDYYCQSYGIKSSKTAERNGKNVKYLFKERKFKDIAEYNCDDLDSTQNLYDTVKKFLFIQTD